MLRLPRRTAAIGMWDLGFGVRKFGHSSTRQPGMSQGHTGLMLCAITVMPTFRKVNDAVCRSALNAMHCSRPEFCTDQMLGKGGQNKVHPWAHPGQPRLGKHAALEHIPVFSSMPRVSP